MNQRNIARIYTAIEDIWHFRASMEAVWPTPTTHDSLKFALTEAAEVVDAEIRQRNYARNNAKTYDVMGELADFFIMTATALGPGPYQVPDVDLDLVDSAHLEDYLAYRAGLALYYYDLGWAVWRNVAIHTLTCIALFPGFDLAYEIARRQDKLRRKWLLPVQADAAYMTASLA